MGKRLTNKDIDNFEKENEKRSIVILTISRRSGEGKDKKKGNDICLINREMKTYQALVN